MEVAGLLVVTKVVNPGAESQGDTQSAVQTSTFNLQLIVVCSDV